MLDYSFLGVIQDKNLQKSTQGGAFSYVGAMHDIFPHALEISKRGFNPFALIYRQGGENACQDLARAISFIIKNKNELKVDINCYSLWGGSAGARMAAWVGQYGTKSFGEDNCPKAGTVIMQYTGLSEVNNGPLHMLTVVLVIGLLIIML